MPSLANLRLGLIVEGHGEEQAAPVLIRRIAHERGFYGSLDCSVRRLTKSQLVKPTELERAVEALSRQMGRGQAIMVLMDADEDCPANLSAELKARCLAAHAHLNVSIVLANREYEGWFLAAASSLAGQRGLSSVLIPPAHPESISGAKEWLTAQMPSDQAYSPTRHQAAFSQRIDLTQARAARSFRKFEKEVVSLLRL
jgi:hypothetical protein